MSKRSPHVDSMAPRILEMNGEGVPSIDIAAALKCSRANISQTLKLYGRKSVTKGGRQSKPDAAPPPESAAECPLPEATEQA